MKYLKGILVLASVCGLIACIFNLKYSVGGVITGVRGSGLVLQNNLSDDLTITSSGTFAFRTKLIKDKAYSVTVKSQPTNPVQTCTVQSGAGTVDKTDITSVVVTCAQAGRYAYVANQTDNTLSEYTIDAASGTLTPIAGSPSIATGIAPLALTVDPNGTYLYVANSGSNTLGVYSIDDATGALTLSGALIPTGANPAAVAISPTGGFLYVANSNGNTVSAYTLQNGAATPVSGSPFATGSQPVSLRTDLAGAFLYVTNFADGTVSAFSINATTGALSALSASPFLAGGSGAGAISIAIDPTGTFAYVANQNAATISGYSIASTGVLGALAGSPATTSAPEALAVDPQGQYLYAANVTSSNAIATYAITTTTGALAAPLTAGSGGILPLSIAVDPARTYVYTANNGSANVSVFSVDISTGALTPIPGSPFAAGNGARSIAID